MKKNFTREYLIEKLGLHYDNDDNIKEKEIIESTRWSIINRIVFQDKDGKCYETFYSEGATECQDESPWEYDETIECVEVDLKEVLVKKWVEVK